MYLQRVYKHNKWLCLFLILFAAAQVINNLRQDAAISPVYVYGMYSEVISPEPMYGVPEIFVDGIRLHTSDFSPFEWEKIVRPIMLFKKQYEWNNTLYDDYISRIIHTNNKKLYINTTTQQQFDDWYKPYLEGCLHKKINDVSVKFSLYSFDGKKLMISNRKDDE